ncbi:hypothetical protein NF699_13120 [Sphingomonadaceae bacterium OTU29LAMAA1]|uniref:hypothetical protein n=1 Tax=Sphingomonas sp. Leaf37 TaxID=2876552 RepID=UPI001E5255DF|nr:hypothetical protein [Sphingomonas sp. Leaf37]USU03999.1 hypothetical protein NF699_13120 [Sphingomonadaceae bacterium OTU29LAMAA1]
MQIDQNAGHGDVELVPPSPEIAGLQPLTTIKSRWPAILGALVTVAMLAGLGHELFSSGLAGLNRATPRNPVFYIAFVGLYLTPPLADYVIFRRLWGIPLAGLVALIKKRIANDVVMGYSGEAYFYAWARQRTRLVAAPFGAVKDVSILSAIAGNAVTLTMIAVALPAGRDLIPPEMMRYVYGSLAVIFGTSLPFLIFSRKVFSLPRAQLWAVFGVHCVRLILGTGFLALAWASAMPEVAIGTWLFLSAGRLLFSRLPLLPNKDLLFANFAILMIGEDQALSELIAFTAAAVLLVHAVLIVGFGVHHLATRRR